MTDPASPYDRYAAIYDRLGQRRFGERIANVILDWLAARNVHPATAIDLACGTGAAAGVLAARGLAVTAIDRSEAMLAEGRRALPALDAIAWRQGDLRALPDLPAVDLATCVYDSVNYLTEEGDLQALFAGVARLVRPGGWFVFDLLTAARYADGWDDATVVAEDTPDLFVLYRGRFDPRSGRSPLTLTAFVRNPERGNAWERFDETHIERAYEIGEIVPLLVQAGFNVAETREYEDVPGTLLGNATPRSERVVVFAQRTGEGR